MSLPLVFAVAAAGAAGCVARLLLSSVIRAAWPDLPLATALVNVLGCFGFGLFAALAHGRWSALATTVVLVGFFGGFTTFSSFAGDCHQLLLARRYGLLFANVLAQNVLGLAALAGGLALGHAVFGGGRG